MRLKKLLGFVKEYHSTIGSVLVVLILVGVCLFTVIDKKLQVVDMTASVIAMEQKMPMYVFSLNEEDSIVKAISGKFNGTVVTV